MGGTTTMVHDSRTGAPAASVPDTVELPTLFLLVATYGAWLAVTAAYGRWPFAVLAPIAIALVTLQSSLQHEILHGHPTPWPTLNRLLAIVPVSLWLPYARYRQVHLTHHRDERLTDPLDDPESFYWTPDNWALTHPVIRALLHTQQTLAGRVLIGPPWHISMFLRGELLAVIRNQRRARRLWAEHLLWCIPVVVWIKVVCGMPLSLYFVAIVMPGYSLVLIRSFAEHRARPEVRKRIAIVERSRILGPLFLFNNLHSLHHEAPTLPWYLYNARYRLNRERLIAENGGLVYTTYFDVARRFLFRAHDAIEHPTGRVPGGRH